MLHTMINFIMALDWHSLLTCYPLYIAIGFTWVIYLGLKKY